MRRAWIQSKVQKVWNLNLPKRWRLEQQSKICLIIILFLGLTNEFRPMHSDDIMSSIQNEQSDNTKEQKFIIQRIVFENLPLNKYIDNMAFNQCKFKKFQDKLMRTIERSHIINKTIYDGLNIQHKADITTQRKQAIITYHAQGSVNPEQNFQRILISTPLQYKYYNNVTFKTAQTNLMNQLQKLMQSSFYSHFIVYFGAENLSHRSYIEQKYKRQEEILKLKIQETKKNIFQLSRANDEIQFDNSMKSYIQSMKIITDRSQDVDHVDFVPCIYVQGKRKKAFYGHLMQQFNRKGAGTFNVKVGLRSPFSKLDTLELNLQTPISNIRRKYFNFDLEWNNSYEAVGKVFTKISHANQSVFRDIDQKSQSFSMGIDRPQSNLRFEWENKVRNPNIHQRFDDYCRRNYHLPSFKSSFRLTKVWQNTIQFNDVNMGRYLETKGQITLPYISKTQFAKFQVNYRKFYDTIEFKKYFDSQLMRKMFSSSSIQANLSWNVMKPITGNYLSDITQNMQVRGFEQARVPTATFSNGKVSAKFNLHNYPLIGQARLTPFLYAQTGFSILDRSGESNKIEQKQRWLYGLGSIGLGVAYYIKAFAQIELIYSLGSYQNIPKREPTNFQIRIGFFD